MEGEENCLEDEKALKRELLHPFRKEDLEKVFMVRKRDGTSEGMMEGLMDREQ